MVSKGAYACALSKSSIYNRYPLRPRPGTLIAQNTISTKPPFACAAAMTPAVPTYGDRTLPDCFCVCMSPYPNRIDPCHAIAHLRSSTSIARSARVTLLKSRCSSLQPLSFTSRPHFLLSFYVTTSHTPAPEPHASSCGFALTISHSRLTRKHMAVARVWFSWLPLSPLAFDARSALPPTVQMTCLSSTLRYPSASVAETHYRRCCTDLRRRSAWSAKSSCRYTQ